MPLKEIKEYLYGRCPENLIHLLELQKKIVHEKIKTLMQISDMMETELT